MSESHDFVEQARRLDRLRSTSVADALRARRELHRRESRGDILAHALLCVLSAHHSWWRDLDRGVIEANRAEPNQSEAA